jgi:hypothetical protein
MIVIDFKLFYMNTGKLLSLAVMAGTFVLIGSCKSDEAEVPNHEFVFNDKTISLAGANIYFLSNSICCNDHSIRSYSITDGVYTNVPGGGWEADDYTGETYFLIITLLEPNGDEHGTGEYPMYPWWDQEPYTNARMSYVDLFTSEGENSLEYLTGDDRDDSPVIIKGGLNIDEKITISFKGQLVHRINSVYDTYEDARLYFSGEVQDVQ